MQAKRYSPFPPSGRHPCQLRCPSRKRTPCPAPPPRSPASATASMSWCATTLGAIGDIWIAFEQDKEFVLAERLGLEFGEDFRLLQDIGWEPGGGLERFGL